ncbi:hypothetical protein MTO98_21185 [Mucilaginibacter sp. SMC90]|uniref:hypothetical protein n=1 Tax=Mucilaginibacter sp. SMC90 TaxID=2929803 RepID=UPI001FB4FA30|nr:hypothetical protein [Mucilaginibacter sp. SMC90]UOE46922.1 hypothetical protein MTO98_21185 [Mucilaginibacter sp. SMC90]
MMKKILVIAFLLFCFSALNAQMAEKFTPALMEAKFGAKQVYNSDSRSFTLDIVTKDIKPMSSPNLVQVDKHLVQFVLISNSAFSQTDTSSARQHAELQGYMQYELDYITGEAKLKISDIEKNFITLNGKLFLLWYYKMPADNNSVLQQINLSTLCFGQALNLNSPVTKGETLEENKDLLIKIAQTLKMNNFKIDLNALYKELQNQ